MSVDYSVWYGYSITKSITRSCLALCVRLKNRDCSRHEPNSGRKLPGGTRHGGAIVHSPERFFLTRDLCWLLGMDKQANLSCQLVHDFHLPKWIETSRTRLSQAKPIRDALLAKAQQANPNWRSNQFNTRQQGTGAKRAKTN